MSNIEIISLIGTLASVISLILAILALIRANNALQKLAQVEASDKSKIEAKLGNGTNAVLKASKGSEIKFDTR